MENILLFDEAAALELEEFLARQQAASDGVLVGVE
jgi:hypothetical protein